MTLCPASLTQFPYRTNNTHRRHFVYRASASDAAPRSTLVAPSPSSSHRGPLMASSLRDALGQAAYRRETISRSPSLKASIQRRAFAPASRILPTCSQPSLPPGEKAARPRTHTHKHKHTHTVKNSSRRSVRRLKGRAPISALLV